MNSSSRQGMSSVDAQWEKARQVPVTIIPRKRGRKSNKTDEEGLHVIQDSHSVMLTDSVIRNSSQNSSFNFVPISQKNPNIVLPQDSPIETMDQSKISTNRHVRHHISNIGLGATKNTGRNSISLPHLQSNTTRETTVKPTYRPTKIIVGSGSKGNNILSNTVIPAPQLQLADFKPGLSTETIAPDDIDMIDAQDFGCVIEENDFFQPDIEMFDPSPKKLYTPNEPEPNDDISKNMHFTDITVHEPTSVVRNSIKSPQLFHSTPPLSSFNPNIMNQQQQQQQHQYQYQYQQDLDEVKQPLTNDDYNDYDDFGQFDDNTEDINIMLSSCENGITDGKRTSLNNTNIVANTSNTGNIDSNTPINDRMPNIIPATTTTTSTVTTTTVPVSNSNTPEYVNMLTTIMRESNKCQEGASLMNTIKKHALHQSSKTFPELNNQGSYSTIPANLPHGTQRRPLISASNNNNTGNRNSLSSVCVGTYGSSANSFKSNHQSDSQNNPFDSQNNPFNTIHSSAIDLQHQQQQQKQQDKLVFEQEDGIKNERDINNPNVENRRQSSNSSNVQYHQQQPEVIIPVSELIQPTMILEKKRLNSTNIIQCSSDGEGNQYITQERNMDHLRGSSTILRVPFSAPPEMKVIEGFSVAQPTKVFQHSWSNSSKKKASSSSSTTTTTTTTNTNTGTGTNKSNDNQKNLARSIDNRTKDGTRSNSCGTDNLSSALPMGEMNPLYGTSLYECFLSDPYNTRQKNNGNSGGDPSNFCETGLPQFIPTLRDRQNRGRTSQITGEYQKVHNSSLEFLSVINGFFEYWDLIAAQKDEETPLSVIVDKYEPPKITVEDEIKLMAKPFAGIPECSAGKQCQMLYIPRDNDPKGFPSYIGMTYVSPKQLNMIIRGTLSGSSVSPGLCYFCLCLSISNKINKANLNSSYIQTEPQPVIGISKQGAKETPNFTRKILLPFETVIDTPGGFNRLATHSIISRHGPELEYPFRSVKYSDFEPHYIQISMVSASKGVTSYSLNNTSTNDISTRMKDGMRVYYNSKTTGNTLNPSSMVDNATFEDIPTFIPRDKLVYDPRVVYSANLPICRPKLVVGKLINTMDCEYLLSMHYRNERTVTIPCIEQMGGDPSVIYSFYGKYNFSDWRQRNVRIRPEPLEGYTSLVKTFIEHDFGPILLEGRPFDYIFTRDLDKTRDNIRILLKLFGYGKVSTECGGKYVIQYPLWRMSHSVTIFPEEELDQGRLLYHVLHLRMNVALQLYQQCMNTYKGDRKNSISNYLTLFLDSHSNMYEFYKLNGDPEHFIIPDSVFSLVPSDRKIPVCFDIRGWHLVPETRTIEEIISPKSRVHISPEDLSFAEVSSTEHFTKSPQNKIQDFFTGLFKTTSPYHHHHQKTANDRKLLTPHQTDDPNNARNTPIFTIYTLNLKAGINKPIEIKSDPCVCEISESVDNCFRSTTTTTTNTTNTGNSTNTNTDGSVNIFNIDKDNGDSSPFFDHDTIPKSGPKDNPDYRFVNGANISKGFCFESIVSGYRLDIESFPMILDISRIFSITPYELVSLVFSDFETTRKNLIKKHPELVRITHSTSSTTINGTTSNPSHNVGNNTTKSCYECKRNKKKTQVNENGKPVSHNNDDSMDVDDNDDDDDDENVNIVTCHTLENICMISRSLNMFRHWFPFSEEIRHNPQMLPLGKCDSTSILLTILIRVNLALELESKLSSIAEFHHKQQEEYLQNLFEQKQQQQQQQQQKQQNGYHYQQQQKNQQEQQRQRNNHNKRRNSFSSSASTYSNHRDKSGHMVDTSNDDEDDVDNMMNNLGEEYFRINEITKQQKDDLQELRFSLRLFANTHLDIIQYIQISRDYDDNSLCMPRVLAPAHKILGRGVSFLDYYLPTPYRFTCEDDLPDLTHLDSIMRLLCIELQDKTIKVPWIDICSKILNVPPRKKTAGTRSSFYNSSSTTNKSNNSNASGNKQFKSEEQKNGTRNNNFRKASGNTNGGTKTGTRNNPYGKIPVKSNDILDETTSIEQQGNIKLLKLIVYIGIGGLYRHSKQWVDFSQLLELHAFTREFSDDQRFLNFKRDRPTLFKQLLSEYHNWLIVTFDPSLYYTLVKELPTWDDFRQTCNTTADSVRAFYRNSRRNGMQINPDGRTCFEAIEESLSKQIYNKTFICKKPGKNFLRFMRDTLVDLEDKIQKRTVAYIQTKEEPHLCIEHLRSAKSLDTLKPNMIKLLFIGLTATRTTVEDLQLIRSYVKSTIPGSDIHLSDFLRITDNQGKPMLDSRTVYIAHQCYKQYKSGKCTQTSMEHLIWGISPQYYDRFYRIFNTFHVHYSVRSTPLSYDMTLSQIGAVWNRFNNRDPDSIILDRVYNPSYSIIYAPCCDHVKTHCAQEGTTEFSSSSISKIGSDHVSLDHYRGLLYCNKKAYPKIIRVPDNSKTSLPIDPSKNPSIAGCNHTTTNINSNKIALLDTSSILRDGTFTVLDSVKSFGNLVKSDNIGSGTRKVLYPNVKESDFLQTKGSAFRKKKDQGVLEYFKYRSSVRMVFATYYNTYKSRAKDICNESPVKMYNCLGNVVHCEYQSGGNVESFTICPRCGCNSIYAHYLYGLNGMMTCGVCDLAERKRLELEPCALCKVRKKKPNRRIHIYDDRINGSNTMLNCILCLKCIRLYDSCIGPLSDDAKYTPSTLSHIVTMSQVELLKSRELVTKSPFIKNLYYGFISLATRKP